LLTREKVQFNNLDKVVSQTFPQQTVLADVRSVEALQSAISENAILINLAAEYRDDVRSLSLYDEINA
jgi:hypothetical protein